MEHRFKLERDGMITSRARRRVQCHKATHQTKYFLQLRRYCSHPWFFTMFWTVSRGDCEFMHRVVCAAWFLHTACRCASVSFFFSEGDFKTLRTVTSTTDQHWFCLPRKQEHDATAVQPIKNQLKRSSRADARQQRPRRTTTLRSGATRSMRSVVPITTSACLKHSARLSTC